MTRPAPLPVAVLLSGGGTTLRNLVKKQDAGRLSVDFKLVISSSPTARGLEYARERDIPTLVVRKEDHAQAETFSSAIFGPIREANIQLAVMGGFLKHVMIPPDFENRVMNIHPALIPAFCGRGMYGDRVHRAVLDYGAKVSGCTVHFVDNQYDHGPIILQRVVPVEDADTVESLAKRVFTAECEAYPAAVQLYAEGKLKMDGRLVRAK